MSWLLIWLPSYCRTGQHRSIAKAVLNFPPPKDSHNLGKKFVATVLQWQCDSISNSPFLHQAWKHICLQAGQRGSNTSHQRELLSASEPAPMELVENFDMDFTGDKTGHLIKMNIFFICMAALYGTICPKTICAASSMEDTDGKVLQSPLKLYGKNITCAQECFFKSSLKNKSGPQGQSDIMMPERVVRAPLLEGFCNLRPALSANCVYKNQG